MTCVLIDLQVHSTIWSSSAPKRPNNSPFDIVQTNIMCVEIPDGRSQAGLQRRGSICAEFRKKLRVYTAH